MTMRCVEAAILAKKSMKQFSATVGAAILLLVGLTVPAEVKVAVERNSDPAASFEFKTVPAPLRNDLAAQGTFTIVDGASDPNGSGLGALNDGRLPQEDGRYRVSANFLNYVVQNYGKDCDLLAKVNAACRQGKYTDDLWKELTGKSLQELNEQWKTALQAEIDQSI